MINAVSAYKIDVFWDGAEGVAVGFPGIALNPQSGLEIDLWVTENGRDSVLLHHFLLSQKYQYLRIPAGLSQLALIAGRGQRRSRVTIDLLPEAQIPPTESDRWRFILVGTEDDSPLAVPFQDERIKDPEQIFHQELLPRVPFPVAWAIAQVRQAHSDEKLVISPTRLIWPPRQSLLWIEPQPSGPSRRPPDPPPQTCIQARAQQERAQRRAPRLHVRQHAGNRGIDRLYGQYFIFFIMRQRRAFDSAVEPIVLRAHDIRQAFEDANVKPAVINYVKRMLPVPDNDGEYVVGFDLGRAIDDLDKGEPVQPGAIVRRVHTAGAQDVSIEIDFPTAALGDEVGVLMLEDSGSSMSVSPVDPGGSKRVRLFEVIQQRPAEASLRARAVAENEQILREVRQQARKLLHAWRTAVSEDSPYLKDQNLFVNALRSKVTGAFSQKLAVDIERATVFDSLLGPIAAVGFANILDAADQEGRVALGEIGGFRSFVHQPSIAAAVAAAPHLARPNKEALTAPDRFPADMGLVRQLATLIDAPALVPATLDPEQERAVFRILRRNEGQVRDLVNMRISLGGPAAAMETTVNRIVGLLQEEKVKDAEKSYRERRDTAQAPALKDYLANRENGIWTPMEEAGRLADAVAAVARRREETARRLRTRPVDPSPRPPLNVDQLRAYVKELLSLARQVRPADVEMYDHIDIDDLDEVQLTSCMRQLQPLVGPPPEKVFALIVNGLERWAGLPQDFALSRAERRPAANGHDLDRSAVVQFVDRTLWSVKALRKAPVATEAGLFPTDLLEELSRRIRAALVRHGPVLRDQEIERELIDYGYVLLFSKVRRMIDELVAGAEAVPQRQAQARRLKGRLTAWPRDAAETWRDAAALGLHAVQPPDFDGEPV